MPRQLLQLLERLYAWEKVDAHRRQVYRRARVLVPLLIAAGFLPTSWTGPAHTVLQVLALLAGASVPTLAKRHT